MKILKHFKGSSRVWVEVHNTQWGNFEELKGCLS